MPKITKLTAEQDAMIPVLREEWRARGLSTERIDHEEARGAIRELYISAKMPPPKMILVAQSPMQALLMRGVITLLQKERKKAKGDQLWDQLRDQLGDQLWDQLGGQLWDQLRDQLRDQLGGQLRGQLMGQLMGQLWGQLRDQLGGQLYQTVWMIGGWDGFWLAFYEAGKRIGATYPALLDQHFQAYSRYAMTCGVAFCYADIAFVSDRPTVARFDEGRRLHCETGPALVWSDGYGICAWHGFRLPMTHEWIVRDSRRLSPEEIDAEPNTELRRIMLEAFGFDRYCEAREARVIASDELHGQPRRLLEVQVGGEPVRIVEVVNGSLEPDGTRRKFHLGAMRGDTPHDVIAASYGIAPKHYREAVRT